LKKAFPSSNATSYLGAAYVKHLESAGARVAPVFINQDQSYYESLFGKINGLLIPGGGASLFNSGELIT